MQDLPKGRMESSIITEHINSELVQSFHEKESLSLFPFPVLGTRGGRRLGPDRQDTRTRPNRLKKLTPS